MYVLITEGIKISVDTFFQPAYSEPTKNRYMHVYNIHIENQNDFPVQLLRRHWFITEADGVIMEVEGEGVIGQQPEIQPGGSHAYSSYCIVKNDVGKMEGYYTMIRLDKEDTFQVTVPAFNLVAPFKLN